MFSAPFDVKGDGGSVRESNCSTEQCRYVFVQDFINNNRSGYLDRLANYL